VGGVRVGGCGMQVYFPVKGNEGPSGAGGRASSHIILLTYDSSMTIIIN
jgi:hypothetical protein